jgi:hypothetical protein
MIREVPYFNKFIKGEVDKNLFELPKCNYCKDHNDSESQVYCFQCNRYLCNICLENRNKFTQLEHITVQQKLNYEYRCKNQGHEEYILDRYCKKCNILFSDQNLKEKYFFKGEYY